MNLAVLRVVLACCLCLLMGDATCRAAEPATRNVILVTIDGLRGEEVFAGCDARLINKDDGGVRDVPRTKERFWHEQAEQRRTRLMPFFWEVVSQEGQIFGAPDHDSSATVKNGHFFSYPGYNELLVGWADKKINSNAKRPNKNVTVLEWLNSQQNFRGRVAAFASWDVFPFILNADRSGVYVNAGWQPLDVFGNERSQREWNRMARELPRYWDGVRYDAFTIRGATEYLQQRKPRVLYVALGETDDWAHDGRYDLYLDAAQRSDRYVRQLWNAAQKIPQYKSSTALIITTDHGRGGGRQGWKSHGRSQPGSDRIWIAAMGPDTPRLGVREKVHVTQEQIAASVAQLLGEDYTGSDPRIAPALPGLIESSP